MTPLRPRRSEDPWWYDSIMEERLECHPATYYPKVELTAAYTPKEMSISGAPSYNARVILHCFKNRPVVEKTTICYDGPNGSECVCLADKHVGGSQTTRDGNGKKGEITYGRNKQDGTGCLVRWPRVQHAATELSKASTQDDNTTLGAGSAKEVHEEGDDVTI